MDPRSSRCLDQARGRETSEEVPNVKLMVRCTCNWIEPSVLLNNR